MWQRQEVQEVLPSLRRTPAAPFGPAMRTAPQIRSALATLTKNRLRARGLSRRARRSMWVHRAAWASDFMGAAFDQGSLPFPAKRPPGKRWLVPTLNLGTSWQTRGAAGSQPVSALALSHAPGSGIRAGGTGTTADHACATCCLMRCAIRIGAGGGVTARLSKG